MKLVPDNQTTHYVTKCWFRICFLICISVLLISPANSQIFMREHGSFTDSTELKQLMGKSFQFVDSLLAKKVLIKRVDILEIKGKKYLLPDGRFDVFEWKDGNWVNFYSNIHHGYNYQSKKFVFENEIYSFGGYGFWKHHGELIKYLWDRNEWEIIRYGKGNPEGKALAYMLDSTLYIIDPISYIDGYKSEAKRGKSFRIDLKTMEKHSFNMHIENIEWINWFETENYMVLPNKPYYLIDKSKADIFTCDITCFKGLANFIGNANAFFQIKNDKMMVYDRNYRLIQEYNIETELKKFVPVKQENGFTKYLLISGGILLLVLSCWSVRRKLNRNRILQNGGPDSFSQPHINELLNLTGKTITAEELDKLFDIEHIMSAETLRFKRSNIIKSINLEMRSKTGRDLITRIQDPIDKRHFLYEINGN